MKIQKIEFFECEYLRDLKIMFDDWIDQNGGVIIVETNITIKYLSRFHDHDTAIHILTVLYEIPIDPIPSIRQTTGSQDKQYPQDY